MAYQINGAQLATLIQNWHSPVIRGILGLTALSGTLVWHHKGLPIPGFGKLIADSAATHTDPSSVSQDIPSPSIPSPDIVSSELSGLPTAELVSAEEITVQTNVPELPLLLDNMSSTSTETPLSLFDASNISLPLAPSNEQKSTLGEPGSHKVGATVGGLAGLAAVAYMYFKNKGKNEKPKLADAELIAWLYSDLKKVTEEKSGLKFQLDMTKKDSFKTEIALVDSVNREEELVKEVRSINTLKNDVEKRVEKLTLEISGLQSHITELNQVQSEQSRHHQAEQEQQGKKIRQLKDAKAGADESLRLDNEQMHELQGQLQALNQTKSRLESDLGCVSSFRESMTLREQESDQQLATVTKECGDLAIKNSNLQQKVVKLKQQKAKISAQYDQLAKARTATTQQLQCFMEDIAKLIEEKQAVIASKAVLEKTAAEQLEKFREEKDRELTMSRSEKDALQCRIAKAAEAYELEKKDSKAELSHHQVDHQFAIDGKNAEIKHLREKTDADLEVAWKREQGLVTELDTLRKEKDAAFSAAKIADARQRNEVNELNTELADTKQKLRGHDEAFDWYANEYAEMEMKLKKAEAKLREFEDGLEQSMQHSTKVQVGTTEAQMAEKEIFEETEDHHARVSEDKVDEDAVENLNDASNNKNIDSGLDIEVAQVQEERLATTHSVDTPFEEDNATTVDVTQPPDEEQIQDACSNGAETEPDEAIPTLKSRSEDDATETTGTAEVERDSPSAPRHFGKKVHLRRQLAEHLMTRNLLKEPYPDDRVIELQLPCFDPCHNDLPIPQPVQELPGTTQDGKERHIECDMCHQWFTKGDLYLHLPLCHVFFAYAVYCKQSKKVFVNNQAFRDMHVRDCHVQDCQTRTPRPPKKTQQPPARSDTSQNATVLPPHLEKCKHCTSLVPDINAHLTTCHFWLRKQVEKARFQKCWSCNLPFEDDTPESRHAHLQSCAEKLKQDALKQAARNGLDISGPLTPTPVRNAPTGPRSSNIQYRGAQTNRQSGTPFSSTMQHRSPAGRFNPAAADYTPQSTINPTASAFTPGGPPPPPSFVPQQPPYTRRTSPAAPAFMRTPQYPGWPGPVMPSGTPPAHFYDPQNGYPMTPPAHVQAFSPYAQSQPYDSQPRAPQQQGWSDGGHTVMRY